MTLTFPISTFAHSASTFMTSDDHGTRSYRADQIVTRRSAIQDGGSITLPRPPGARRLHSLVSAGLLAFAGLLVQPLEAQSANAEPSILNSNALPALGNTTETDRLLLREISDTYVHTEDPSFIDALKSLETRQPGALKNQSQSDSMAPDSWDFVSNSTRLSMPEHDRVAFYLEQYRSEARWISNILNRARPFVGYVVDELDKRYLPVELALLPAIESGYQPDVVSPKNAAGIWQIIPATAQDIGIAHNAWFDGRADIQQSTIAAIDYLSYLNAEFHGDWLLTLAAYNAGLGRVRSAVKRNVSANKPADFWSLQLPTETRDYVPKFLALVALLREGEAAGMEIPKVSRGSAFDVVDINARFSLDKLSELTNLPLRRLQRLNAGLVHGITPPEGPHTVYVPQGFGEPLVAALRATPELALYTLPDTHKVVAGDSLSSLALRYGVYQQQIMELNALDSEKIKIGQILKIIEMPEGPSGTDYVVSIGDTLSDIAQRFSVDINDIRDAQGQRLRDDVIHPGERLSFLTQEDTTSAN